MLLGCQDHTTCHDAKSAALLSTKACVFKEGPGYTFLPLLVPHCEEFPVPLMERAECSDGLLTTMGLAKPVFLARCHVSVGQTLSAKWAAHAVGMARVQFPSQATSDIVH